MHTLVSILSLGLALLSFSSAEDTASEAKPSEVNVQESLQENLVKASGSKVINYSIKGTPTHFVLYHSASWCGTCKLVTPKLIEAYKATAKKGNRAIEFILMNYDSSQEEMNDYMVSSKINFPGLKQAETRKHVLGQVYPTKSLPTIVLIDAKGKVVSADQEEVFAKIAALSK